VRGLKRGAKGGPHKQRLPGETAISGNPKGSFAAGHAGIRAARMPATVNRTPSKCFETGIMRFMELTKIERLILFNQYRILGKLDPDDARASDEACKILESGYTLEYETLASHIDTEVSEEQCREVRDVLDMYRALKIAYRDLPAGTLTAGDATFLGFDGNEETEQFAYATFLIEMQDKWGESKQDPRNSHWPVLSRYRTMLRSWKESANKWELTPVDTARILSPKDRRC